MYSKAVDEVRTALPAIEPPRACVTTEGGLGKVSYVDGLTEQDIRTAIKNSSGYRPSLFVPEAAHISECIYLLTKVLIYRIAHICGDGRHRLSVSSSDKLYDCRCPVVQFFA